MVLELRTPFLVYGGHNLRTAAPKRAILELQVKVQLREPLRSRFLACRDRLAEDNAGLIRIAIREYLDRHEAGQPMPAGAAQS